jgi:phosphotransferase system enzyme I (PtsI)
METGSANPNLSDARASPEEIVVAGTGAAPGIAVGTAYRYDASGPDVRRDAIEPEEVDAELERLANALQRAQQELETVRALVPDTSEADPDAIIEGQALMLRDDELRRALRRHIRENRESVGRAVQSVLTAHRQRLEASDDEYIRERTDDLEDLEKRLLWALRRGKVARNMETHSVLVAQALTVTDLLRFSRHSLLGCVTAEGGATSHVAIVAKALNLPVVAGAPDALKAVSSGDAVVVDGDDGRVVVHPRESTLEPYRARRDERDPARRANDGLDWPVRTATGQVIRVRANVGVEAELDLLDVYGSDGIGLFRTELFFLTDGDGMLAETHQADVYRRVAEAGGPSGATIRLLDLGGDERTPRIHAGPSKPHPYLGRRGTRALLDRPDELLRPQLRALLRANWHGSIRGLLPMVTDLDEVRRVQQFLTEEADRLARNGVAHDPDLPLGMMVEVPAAALQVHAFAEHVDFFSIGTNDLTQYVLAADRGNDWVAARHDALHPAVLGLIVRVVEAGRMAGCSVEVCGEIAADVQAVPVLLGVGVDTLSVSPQYLPDVQRIIRAVRLADAKGLARKALDATDAETVRRRAREWVDTHVSSSTRTPGRGASGD